MKLSKNSLKQLTKKYRAILIKCSILNTCVLFGTTSAMAFAPYESTYYKIEQGTGGDITDISINGTNYKVSYTDKGNNTSSNEPIKFNVVNDLGAENDHKLFKEINAECLATCGGAAISNESSWDSPKKLFIDAIKNTSIFPVTEGDIRSSGEIQEKFKDRFGGTVFNKATLYSVVGDFVFNQVEKFLVYENSNVLSYSEGGAIDNKGEITNIIGNFIANSTDESSSSSGGAIHNTGSIENISGTFISNSSRIGIGGAISNYKTISKIEGEFISNTSRFGGAIYNEDAIENIAADFKYNFSYSVGGAIQNRSIIKSLTGDFIENYAQNSGGAIYNNASTENDYLNLKAINKNIQFNGNYVKANDGKGGAIYNELGIINLFASEGKSITFVGGNDTDTKKDTDGIYNLGRININGNGTENYKGTVNLYTVNGTGTTNIYDGIVNAKGNISQDSVNLIGGTTHLFNNITVSNIDAQGGSLSLIDNAINNPTITSLTLTDNLNVSLDVDLAEQKIDTLSVTTLVDNSNKIHISGLNLIGNLVAGKTTVDFADTNLLNYITLDADSYTLGGFVYKVTYDETTGQLTFVNIGPIPSQGDIGSNVVKGVFSGIKNTIASANNAVNNSIRDRFNSTSNTTSQKGQSGGDEEAQYGLWAQTIYSHVNRDKTGSSAGFKGHSEGVVLGADAEVAENVIAGFAYAYTNSNMKSNGAKSDIDTHGFYTYGQYKPSDWFINGSIGFGLSKADPKGSDKDIKSKFYSIDALAGYEMNYDFGNLTPAGGLRYIRIEQDSYRENGSKIEAKDADTLTAVVQLGWNNVYQVAGKEITPKASVGFIYDVKSENNKITVSSAGAKFLTEDGRLKRFGTEISVGADAKLTNNWNVSLDYTGEFRQHYENHTGTVSVRYDF